MIQSRRYAIYDYLYRPLLFGLAVFMLVSRAYGCPGCVKAGIYQSHPEFHAWRFLLMLWISYFVADLWTSERKTPFRSFAAFVFIFAAVNAYLFSIVVFPLIRLYLNHHDSSLEQSSQISDEPPVKDETSLLLPGVIAFIAAVIVRCVNQDAILLLTGCWLPAIFLIPFILANYEHRLLPGRILLLFVILLSPLLSLPIADLAHIRFYSSFESNGSYIGEQLIDIFWRGLPACVMIPGLVGLLSYFFYPKIRRQRSGKRLLFLSLSTSALLLLASMIATNSPKGF
jgi:hypothetical protein